MLVMQGDDAFMETDIMMITTQKKSFPLKIYSVNVTQPAGNFGFGHIY